MGRGAIYGRVVVGAIALVAWIGLAGAPASPAGSGETGTLNVTVEYVDGGQPETVCWALSSVDEDGRFTFWNGALPLPNPFTVNFTGPNVLQIYTECGAAGESFAQVHYDQKSSLQTADIIDLAPGEVRDITIEVGPPATLNGTVIAEFGAPMPQVWLQVLASDGTSMAAGASSEEGTYSVEGLRQDDYTIRFLSDTFGFADFEVWHEDGAIADEATPVFVPYGDTVTIETKIDVNPIGSVGITVYDHPTLNTFDDCVDFFGDDGARLDDEFGRLPAGIEVRARWWDCAEDDDDERYSMQWYRYGARSFDEAEPIEVPLFEVFLYELLPDTYGPDDGVTRVWGRVLDENGSPVVADLVLSAPDGTEILRTRSDWVDGFYELFAVPEGPAHLEVIPTDPGYARDAFGGAGANGRGAQLDLMAFETVTVDFVVEKATGVLVGEVTDPAGVSLGAATVQVFEIGGELVAETETGIYGTYLIAELPPGSYRVAASLDGFFDAWSLAAPALEPDAASVIAVEPDAVTSADVVLTARFTDTATSTFSTEIDWLRDRGVTAGCGGGGFCPDDSVTRAQMATFLARALDLQATAGVAFEDVSGVHADSIAAIAEAGITQGCDPTGVRFCPTAPVTRAQMASFLARALDLAPSPTDAFVDDNRSPHEANINAIRAADMTRGCTPDGARFCPDDVVTRGQMAAFLFRAFATRAE